MRDMNRVVIAEDDYEVRSALRKFIEGAGGYQVWVISKCEDILDVLDDSNAYWLILDLELEDGVSKDHIPTVRSMFGTDVYILVLTGNHDIYSEKVIFSAGADMMLRKPYDPVAMLQQMNLMRDRVTGVGRALPMHSKLVIEGKVVDLDSGSYTDDEKGVVTLSAMQKLLLRVLASSRDDDGNWRPIPRNEVILSVFGGKYGNKDFEFNRSSGSKLRQLVLALRRLFTGENLDDETLEDDLDDQKRYKVINVARGRDHTSLYSLDKDVEFIPGNQDF